MHYKKFSIHALFRNAMCYRHGYIHDFREQNSEDVFSFTRCTSHRYVIHTDYMVFIWNDYFDFTVYDAKDTNGWYVVHKDLDETVYAFNIFTTRYTAGLILENRIHDNYVSYTYEQYYEY